MIKLLTENYEIQNEIKKLFQQASEIKCAVAFWGNGAIDIFQSNPLKSLQIVCNLMSGGTNPDEINRIKKGFANSVRIRMDNKLHAKVFWTNKGFVLGSANASCNGLALESDEITGWKEACIVSDDPILIRKIKEWFNESIWSNARDIQKSDLIMAQKRWRPKKEKRFNPNSSMCFIEALKSGVYSKRKIHIVIDTKFTTKEQENQGKKLENDLKKEEPWLKNKKIDFWVGFDKIPRGATIFNFYCEDANIGFISIFYTIPKTDNKKYRNYQFCTPAKPSSIEMPVKHALALRKAVTLLYKEKAVEIAKNEPILISLEKFTELVMQRKDILKKICD